MIRSIVRSLPSFVRVASVAPTLALLAACSAPSASVASVNAHPATIDDAKATAEQLELLLATNASDPEALAAEQTFHARLDELNHLIVRIAPRDGYVVSFFDTGNGSVAIEETQPEGAPSLVAAADPSSPAAVYRALTGGLEPPPALATLEPRPIDAMPADLTPGPAPSSDEEQSSRIHTENGIVQAQFNCYSGGDFHTCQMEWANGGSWNKNGKTSFFEIAPSSTLYVQFTHNGNGFFVPVYSGSITHFWGQSQAYVYKTCTLGIFCSSYTDYGIENHNWQLMNAAGVSFNWSTEFRWNCSYTACNSL